MVSPFLLIEAKSPFRHQELPELLLVLACRQRQPLWLGTIQRSMPRSEVLNESPLQGR